jgi:hypothetical protein
VPVFKEVSGVVGQKYDGDKSPVLQGFLKYFPRAIEAVAKVSLAGAKKYNNGKFPTSWREVPEGELRYGDAEVRHILEVAKGDPIDKETGCLHLAHHAWNAMAQLELFLNK